MLSKKEKELKLRKEPNLEPSRAKETKTKLVNSQEEPRNQDKDKMPTLRLKTPDKRMPDQASGKREQRHQQEKPTQPNNSQDKLVTKTLKPRELRGSLPSPRDVKTLPKTPSLRLLSPQPRSFMVSVVKWPLQPPVAREPRQESRSK